MICIAESPKHEREKSSLFKDNIIFIEDLKESINQLLQEENLSRWLDERLIYKLKFLYTSKKLTKKITLPYYYYYYYLSSHESSKNVPILYGENFKTLLKGIQLDLNKQIYYVRKWEDSTAK